MKKTLTTALFMCLVHNVNAQIYGGDSYVPLPTFSLDNSAAMNYMSALRRMSDLNDRLVPVINDVYSKAKQEYQNHNYRGCCNVISDFFQRVTIFRAQAPLCCYLYELRGNALIELGDISNAIANLRRSIELGNPGAESGLQRIFRTSMTEAYTAYVREQYYVCHLRINTALSTGLHSYDLYLLEGDAFLAEHKFKEARASYKTARKLGAPNADESLRQLKETKKQFRK